MSSAAFTVSLYARSASATTVERSRPRWGALSVPLSQGPFGGGMRAAKSLAPAAAKLATGSARSSSSPKWKPLAAAQSQDELSRIARGEDLDIAPVRRAGHRAAPWSERRHR